MPIYQELPKIDNPIFYSASAAVDYLFEKEKSIQTHSWFSQHHFKVHNCLAVARRLIAGRFMATEWRQDYTLGWEAAKKIRDELFDLIEQDITHSLECTWTSIKRFVPYQTRKKNARLILIGLCGNGIMLIIYGVNFLMLVQILHLSVIMIMKKV
ncbi:hypothetical protein BDC45DRAFT_559933, partial [Circinella umbellata]